MITCSRTYALHYLTGFVNGLMIYAELNSKSMKRFDRVLELDWLYPDDL